MSDTDFNEDLGTGGKIKNWLQDNVRIILSVLIVVAIAAGIYSYSKRVEESPVEKEIVLNDELFSDEEMDQSDAVTIIGDEENAGVAEEDQAGDQMTEVVDEPAEEIEPVQQQEVPAQEEPVVMDEPVKVDQQEQPTTISEETDEAFVQTAVIGDSKTVLARKALKAYLEKNGDSSLTLEHKIYIEDYLRKNVNYTGSVRVGTQISFSKTLINNGIEMAKSLTPAQLENLKKYSARVSTI